MARTFPNNGANRLKVGGNPAVLDLPGAGKQHTIAGWFKFNTLVSTGNITLINKYNGSIGPLLRINDGVGLRKRLGMFTIDTLLSGHEAIGATDLTTGVWYHLAGTWNGSSANISKTLGCWVNGARDGSATSGGQHTTSDTANGWTVGARANNGTLPFDGDACEIAIWQTDLSAGGSSCPELAALAKGISPLMIRRDQLVAYWPTFGDFDNGIDYSGNKNNLALVGTLASANHGPVAPQVPLDPLSMARG